MVNQKIQVGKIRNLDHVSGVAMLFIEQTGGQSLVDTNVLHLEPTRVFERGISDLLIVQPPAVLVFSQSLVGITLPGVNFQLLRLHLHAFLVLSSQIRRNQAVTHHAARPRELVHHVAGLHHLIGRQDVHLIGQPRDAADRGYVRIAVEEYLFDIVLQV